MRWVSVITVGCAFLQRVSVKELQMFVNVKIICGFSDTWFTIMRWLM